MTLTSFTHRLVAVGVLTLLAGPGLRAQELSLEDALSQALSFHPALAAASARVGGADATLDAARAQRLPSVMSSAALTRFQEPMLVAPLHAFDPTNIPDFDRSVVRGEVGAQYTLFEGGARGARIRSAGAVADAGRAAVRSTEAQVIEAVTEAYLTVGTARAVLDAATGLRQALEAEHRRAEQRLAQGTAARVEVLRAQAALLDAQAQETTAQARVTLAERALARLMGVEAEAVLDRPVTSVSLPTGVEGTAVHPRVARSLRTRDAARARVDQERASRLPHITANAAVLDYGTLSNTHVAEWQAGVRVSWPIFTGGARGASIRRAEANLRAAEEDARMVELEVATAADVAQAAVVESVARGDALRAAVAQWEEVARIEALSLNEGAGVQSDLLRAQAGLFQARAGHARARHDTVLATVRLAAARGLLDMEWMTSALELAR